MRAILRAVSPLTADSEVRVFQFEPVQRYDYQAGQFTELSLYEDPAIKHDGRGRSRQFSLFSSPDEPLPAVAVNFRDSRSSFKRALRAMRPGDEFDASQALGDFVLPLSPARPMVWIAGGIGITPFRSMAAGLRGQAEGREIHLFHSFGRQSGPDCNLRAFGLAAGLSSYTEHDSAGPAGRLQAPAIVAGAHDQGDHLYYIAGPATMVRQLAGDLKNCGIQQERIVTDAFLGYQ